MLYAGGSARADETVAAIIAAGGRAIAVGGDVADEHDMAGVFDRVEQEWGGIDVVVNTAGIMLLSPLAALDLADLDRMHRVNIRGTFVVSQQAARRVRIGGAIINFSTSVTKLQFPGYAAYAAGKGAVNAMTLVLAPLFLNGKDQDEIDSLAKAAPLERLGTPADIAEVISFLAGPARWVNGQILYVNGGVI